MKPLMLALLWATAACAGDVTMVSGDRRAAFLELFSSEGCSSCPPAERWLRDLDAQPGLWKEFVPVSWHVDYWDYLGWRDRFSEASSTSRQRSYAATWGSTQIYTPCFVLNGKEWRARSVPAVGPEIVGRLEARITEDRVKVRFTPAREPGGAREVWVALLSGREETAVKAGENRGATLGHGFVVLGLSRGRLSAERDVLSADLAKPRATGARAVAVWVTAAGSIEPEQATGGWLASH